MMGPQQLVQASIRKYNEEIRPYMDQGNYELASIAMASLNLGLGSQPRDIQGNVHRGLLIFGSALEGRLREGDSWKIAGARRCFEDFAAQAELTAA